MASPTPCNCLHCLDGVPTQYKVIVSGTTNRDCSECAGFDGTYILDRSTDQCSWTTNFTSFCNYTWMTLSIAGDCSGRTFTLGVGPPDELTNPFTYVKSDAPVCWPESEYTLQYHEQPFFPNTQCHWPAT